MGLINGLNAALGTPKPPLCTVISAMASPHSHKIRDLLTDILSCLAWQPLLLCATPTGSDNTWDLCWAALQGWHHLCWQRPFAHQEARRDQKIYSCTCAKSTGHKCFRWHSTDAVQPATLNQHKLHREDEQDERSFIVPQAENTLRLLLVVPDSPERKHNDSHRADLLLETSELMVGPTDLMQCAAVTNNLSVALRKSLLESSE